ncbi:MAG: SAM-dependent methyltransferase [Bacteroidales bacterium]|nr:SAM-dependent methyltransferase [Bacteroidales bacterium]
MQNESGILYLLPTPLGENTETIPLYNQTLIETLRIFVVEEIRTARRFLRKIIPAFPLDDCQFYILNEHTVSTLNLHEPIQLLLQGQNIGMLSEAGLPCIADPGSELVMLAQEKNIRIIPLAGPSSVFMALMASGLCGQHFTFHGYLPAEKTKLVAKLRNLEQVSGLQHQTQLFIETPYRNHSLFETILKTCKSHTFLSLACNISSEDEYIKTKTIQQWRQTVCPQLHKKPCVFALLATGNNAPELLSPNAVLIK